MEELISLAVVFVLVLLASAWWLSARLTRASETALGGVWVASQDEFCRAAEIDAMMLVIGEPVEDFSTLNPFALVTRPAQLVILDGIHSGSFDLSYRRGYSFSAEKYEITCELGSASADCEEILWDGPVRITMDIPRGLMVIVDSSDEIVAVLSRDNAATESCQD